MFFNLLSFLKRKNSCEGIAHAILYKWHTVIFLKALSVQGFYGNGLHKLLKYNQNCLSSSGKSPFCAWGPAEGAKVGS